VRIVRLWVLQFNQGASKGLDQKQEELIVFTLLNPVKTEDLEHYVVTSPACPMCGDQVSIKITPDKLYAYNQGAYVQQVLSEHPADVRERFISGVCGTCWVKLFTEE
jgi:hypothetical protein